LIIFVTLAVHAYFPNLPDNNRVNSSIVISFFGQKKSGETANTGRKHNTLKAFKNNRTGMQLKPNSTFILPCYTENVNLDFHR